MKTLLIVGLLAIGVLSGCGEKVYSADAVFKTYQEDGKEATEYVELKDACAKDRDGGEPSSKTCKVWNLVTGMISGAETRAYIQEKYGK